MHAHLLAHQRALTDADLVRYAADLGLDPARLERDLALHAHAGRIEEDVRSGEHSGVEGTPTLFVDGVRHEGGHDAETLLAVLTK